MRAIVARTRHAGSSTHRHRHRVRPGDDGSSCSCSHSGLASVSEQLELAARLAELVSTTEAEQFLDVPGRYRDVLGPHGVAELEALRYGGEALGQAGRETVPVAVRPVFEEITAIIGELCAEHLDEEYAQLCCRLTGKLARKRPSPLVRGDRRIWAAGIVYAIGRVNFLSDPGADPHLRSDELARLLGVKQRSMADKGRLIMDTLRIFQLAPEWSRRDMIEKNPLVWLVEVDGLVVDARRLPEPIQVEAWRRGLIPYVPAQAEKQNDRA